MDGESSGEEDCGINVEEEGGDGSVLADLILLVVLAIDGEGEGGVISVGGGVEVDERVGEAEEEVACGVVDSTF